MTNAQKYKGVYERAKAQEEFCNNHECGDCPCGYTLDDCDKGLKKWQLCVLRWLELDEEKKIEPCPLCGGIVYVEYDKTAPMSYSVKCACGYSSSRTPDEELAIAAHNRVARAAWKAAKEGAEG